MANVGLMTRAPWWLTPRHDGISAYEAPQDLATDLLCWHATWPEPLVAEVANQLRRRGALRLVVAPWFLAPGRIIDRMWTYVRENAIPMAPLGAHRIVAEMARDRYDQALANHAAA